MSCLPARPWSQLCKAAKGRATLAYGEVWLDFFLKLGLAGNSTIMFMHFFCVKQEQALWWCFHHHKGSDLILRCEGVYHVVTYSFLWWDPLSLKGSQQEHTLKFKVSSCFLTCLCSLWKIRGSLKVKKLFLCVTSMLCLFIRVCIYRNTPLRSYKPLILNKIKLFYSLSL